MNTILYFQSRQNPNFRYHLNADAKLAGVQEIGSKCDWHIQVVDGIPASNQVAQLIEFWQAAGAIVECGGNSATIDPAAFGGLPIVFFDHDPSCLPKGTFCVTHNSAATGQMAARELMRGGISEFAYVPYPEHRFWSDEREKGFVKALSLNGRGCRVFDGRVSANDPTRYQAKLRKFLCDLPKPCGLFAANDKIASEAITAASFMGIKVPDELSVIGVDNTIEICERTKPTISSVRPDFRRGGELAALMLLARLRDGAKFRGARHRTFGPLEVVCRASTRILAAHDPEVERALDLIRREACSDLKADNVLGRFKCSRRMAEMRFRKATGRSVLDEIHAVRLDRAKQLLEHGSMPLKAISDFCGFRNPNSLRKFFLKATGMTMSDYRIQHH